MSVCDTKALVEAFDRVVSSPVGETEYWDAWITAEDWLKIICVEHECTCNAEQVKCFMAGCLNEALSNNETYKSMSTTDAANRVFGGECDIILGSGEEKAFTSYFVSRNKERPPHLSSLSIKHVDVGKPKLALDMVSKQAFRAFFVVGRPLPNSGGTEDTVCGEGEEPQTQAPGKRKRDDSHETAPSVVAETRGVPESGYCAPSVFHPNFAFAAPMMPPMMMPPMLPPPMMLFARAATPTQQKKQRHSRTAEKLSPFSKGLSIMYPRNSSEVILLRAGAGELSWNMYPSDRSQQAARTISENAQKLEFFLSALVKQDGHRLVDVLYSLLNRGSMREPAQLLMQKLMAEHTSMDASILNRIRAFVEHHSKSGTRNPEEQKALDAIMVAVTFIDDAGTDGVSTAAVANRLGMRVDTLRDRRLISKELVENKKRYSGAPARKPKSSRK